MELAQEQTTFARPVKIDSDKHSSNSPSFDFIIATPAPAETVKT